ncbi:TauD/TfdA dioxygenase family protein [Nocardia amikacinitolerans]|uniref:TauD/TfdA dioxygenase family protein n=1 Tax=Nocardia amikacinitolerans TaxID=756689 RepID=UPI002646662C|nr:TauD/TfdA family dioxygenase [Nocardia amikacinitolerans]
MPTHRSTPGRPSNTSGCTVSRAPDEGGESLIAMCDAFFQQAPDDLLDTMHEILVEYRNRIADYYKDHPGRAEHPRVKPIQIDPDTGRRRLVIGFTDPDDPTRTHDAAVVGYSADESAELLRRIEAELHKPAVLYTHKWRAGEVMVLDNRRVLHGRAAFPNQTRKIVRLSVA